MNRVIKFRVWDTELKIWVNNIGMQRNNILCNGNEKRFHVMQFTGLYDKNGVEVYEGDECLINSSPSKWVIRWFQPYCGFCFENNDEAYPLNEGNDIEITGNIHQTTTPSI